MLRSFFVSFVIFVLGVTLQASEPVGVMVSALSPPREMTREKMIELLTGRVKNWPDGERAVLIISHGPGGEAAVQNLIARDVTRLMRGWKRLVFGSGGSLPLVVNDDSSGIDLIARTPNAVMPLAGSPTGTLPAGVRYLVLP